MIMRSHKNNIDICQIWNIKRDLDFNKEISVSFGGDPQQFDYASDVVIGE